MVRGSRIFRRLGVTNSQESARGYCLAIVSEILKKIGQGVVPRSRKSGNADVSSLKSQWQSWCTFKIIADTFILRVSISLQQNIKRNLGDWQSKSI